MKSSKFSTIGHSQMSICNPISSEKLNRLIKAMPLSSAHSAVDFGAGKCEILIRLIERYGISALAVDTSNDFLADANRSAQNRIPEKRLTTVFQDANAFIKSDPDPSFDVGICTGSTHLFGGSPEHWTCFRELLNPMVTSSSVTVTGRKNLPQNTWNSCKRLRRKWVHMRTMF